MVAAVPPEADTGDIRLAKAAVQSTAAEVQVCCVSLSVMQLHA